MTADPAKALAKARPGRWDSKKEVLDVPPRLKLVPDPNDPSGTHFFAEPATGMSLSEYRFEVDQIILGPAEMMAP